MSCHPRQPHRFLTSPLVANPQLETQLWRSQTVLAPVTRSRQRRCLMLTLAWRGAPVPTTPLLEVHIRIIRAPYCGIHVAHRLLFIYRSKKKPAAPKGLPGGHQPQYYPVLVPFNFGVRMGSGLFDAVWPLRIQSTQHYTISREIQNHCTLASQLVHSPPLRIFDFLKGSLMCCIYH